MYNWTKGIATWQVGKRLYISVPFTWLLEEAEAMGREHGDYVIGGPALMRPNECEGFEPLLFHNPCATFTSRGCPNSCEFCAVPRLEGDLREIVDFRPAPMVCDNNLLAASRKHIGYVVEKLKVFPKVDFNQGLEAQRFTPEIAGMLGRLNCKVRFAFDFWGEEGAVKDAVDLCRQYTTKDIGVYCLVGYGDTPDDARAKLELVRSWGVQPFPMRYQPLDLKRKNGYLAPGWTEREMRRMMKYYSRLNWLGGIPYEDFSPLEQMEMF